MADRATRIADEELMRIVATGDPVSAIHRRIVGSAVRLHIPLRDPISLRDAAKALRTLASSLERLSHSQEPTWIVLSQARSTIGAANLVINPNYGKRSNTNNGP